MVFLFESRWKAKRGGGACQKKEATEAESLDIDHLGLLSYTKFKWKSFFNHPSSSFFFPPSIH